MFVFINIPARIVLLLEYNMSPAGVARGVCLGMFLGFIPLNGLMALFLFLVFFLFKINQLSAMVTLPLFKLFYVFGVSALADRIGGLLLIDTPGLSGFWSFVTGLPVLALLDLNNTLVAGGFALSIVLALPVFFLARWIYAVFIQKNIQRIQSSVFAKRFAKFVLVNTIVKKMDLVRRRTG